MQGSLILNEIDALSAETQTIDFKTGNPTGIHYPKAKIIDMYGWIKYGRLTKEQLNK